MGSIALYIYHGEKRLGCFRIGSGYHLVWKKKFFGQILGYNAIRR